MAEALRVIKVFVFSQPFPIYPDGSARDPRKRKAVERDDFGREYDVDAAHLKSFFQRLRGFHVGLPRVKQNQTLNQVIGEVKKEMDGGFLCYMFIFLTYSGGENMLQLNIADTEKPEDALHDIQILIDRIDQIPAVHDTPKIYLIQADDLTLSEPKKAFKAGGSASEEVKAALHGNNSLIAVSTIPQNVTGQVSFLVRAFVELFEANQGQKNAPDVMEDVKRRVKLLVNECSHERRLDLPEVKVVNDLYGPLYI